MQRNEENMSSQKKPSVKRNSLPRTLILWGVGVTSCIFLMLCILLVLWVSIEVRNVPPNYHITQRAMSATRIGINPDELSDLEIGDFPYVYFKRLIDQMPTDARARLTRSDIHKLMGRYKYERVVTCGTRDNNWDAYFFFDKAYVESNSVWANYESSRDNNPDLDKFLGFYVIEKETIRSISCEKVFYTPTPPR